MSRYVDTEWLENNAKEYSLGYYEEDERATPISLLETAPSIDIVFCEKCRECVEKGVGADCPSGYGYLYCKRKKSVVDETDYCSWGVER